MTELESRLTVLTEEHQKLDRQIQQELQRPMPDGVTIAGLKKLKLKTKDALFALQRH